MIDYQNKYQFLFFFFGLLLVATTDGSTNFRRHESTDK